MKSFLAHKVAVGGWAGFCAVNSRGVGGGGGEIAVINHQPGLHS